MKPSVGVYLSNYAKRRPKSFEIIVKTKTARIKKQHKSCTQTYKQVWGPGAEVKSFILADRPLTKPFFKIQSQYLTIEKKFTPTVFL